MKSKYIRNRSIGIDLVKTLAVILVIVVHHFNTIGFYENTYNHNGSMFIATSIYIISLSCVPLFLISTGYLLGNREINWNHFKKLKFFIIEVILIYAIGVFTTLLFANNLSLLALKNQLIYYLKHPNYYVGLYLSLYLIAPFINRLFDNLTFKEQNLFLIMTVFVISFPNFLNNIMSVTIFDTRPSSLWALLYYVLGVYIKRNQPKIKRSYALLFVLSGAMLYTIAVFINLDQQTYRHIYGYYQNVFTLLISTFIFLGLYDIKYSFKYSNILFNLISSSSLTIYIFSGMYSDSKAMDFIALSGTLLFDLVTIPKKVFLSIFFSIPMVLIINFFMNIIKRR